MKKLIFNYLTQSYKIDGDIIIKNSLTGKIHVFPSYISNDLEKIFALNRKQLKWYIKSWIHSKNKGYNFNKYWKERGVFELVYAPYIPITTVGVVEGFTPSQQMLSRYATIPVNNRYFGKITINANNDE